MTAPDAAIPNDDDRRVLVEHKPQPGRRVRLACPNCNRIDRIVVVFRAEIERGVDRADSVGVTDPEVAYTDEIDEAYIIDAPEPTPVAVRCDNCRWAYRGGRPLERLVHER